MENAHSQLDQGGGSVDREGHTICTSNALPRTCEVPTGFSSGARYKLIQFWAGRVLVECGGDCD